MKVRRVVGASMLPTLKHGQRVLIRRVYIKRRLRVGDIVVIKHEGVEKIKRLHALQAGMVEVRGDNLQASRDSRQFGSIPIALVTGKVLFRK